MEFTAAGGALDMGFKAAGVEIKALDIGSGVESWLFLSYFLSFDKAGIAVVCFCEDSSNRGPKPEARISSQSSY